MEDNNEEWVMVKPILDKDLWKPTSSSNETEKKDLKVRFNEAAKHWTDAVPIGNGRLGGMVWGGVSTEIINLNGKVFIFITTHLSKFKGFKVLSFECVFHDILLSCIVYCLYFAMIVVLL